VPVAPRKDFSRRLCGNSLIPSRNKASSSRDRAGAGRPPGAIAGERRWRAPNSSAWQKSLSSCDRPTTGRCFELALIENLQRENLNAIEEAQGYAQLTEQFQLKQEEVATKVGKSRAAVAMRYAFLKLPLLQASIREGRLRGPRQGHTALSVSRTSASASERIFKEGLNVRQTEALVARLQAVKAAASSNLSRRTTNRDAHVASLENQLRERLGTKVHLRYARAKRSGNHVFSDAELERILHILGIAE